MARPESGNPHRARGAARRRRLARAAALALAALAAGCQPHAAADLSELRVSAIPDQTRALVLRQHQPVLDAVCVGAKITCRWIDVESYEELVDRFGRGEVDLVFFGGVTFAQARHRHGAIPLVMRDVDTRFTSSVVVRSDAPARRLEDLRGTSFGFGAPSSTSGHFMARYFMRRAGVEPERDFTRVIFSGTHDRTMRMVAAGEIAAGAVNSSIAYEAIGPGGEMRGKLRIVWQSPPYTDYVWAAGRHVPEALRARLTDAFLDLDGSTPQSRLALERERARGYVPAYDEDFAAVREVVRERGAL